MKETTLCYLEQDGQYLLMYRNAKASDPNKGKWIGIGGKLEEGETPDQCVCREVLEETGLRLTEYRYRGQVHFKSDRYPEELMHLYTATAWTGELHECDEGELDWIEKEKLKSLTLWKGDLIFLGLLDSSEPFFSLKLCYKEDTLVFASLNGEKINID